MIVKFEKKQYMFYNERHLHLGLRIVEEYVYFVIWRLGFTREYFEYKLMITLTVCHRRSKFRNSDVVHLVAVFGVKALVSSVRYL